MTLPHPLISFSLLLLFASCNGENEVKNSSSQKSDSTRSESTDTLTTCPDPYPNGNRDIKNSLSNPIELFEQIETGKVKVYFHGIVTEPFLDIYLTETELLYLDKGSEIQKTYLLLSKFDKNLKSQSIIYEDESGKQKKLEIKKEPGSDGMSDRTYPYRLLIDDWQGGGDCKRMVDKSEYEE